MHPRVIFFWRNSARPAGFFGPRRQAARYLEFLAADHLGSLTFADTTRQFGQTLGVAVLGIAYQAGGLAPVYVVAALCGGVTGLLALLPRKQARVPA